MLNIKDLIADYIEEGYTQQEALLMAKGDLNKTKAGIKKNDGFMRNIDSLATRMERKDEERQVDIASKNKMELE